MGRTSDRHARYSDGDAAERKMLAAVRGTSDVSLESEELMGKVKDRASYYHLGIGRSAILRCLDLPAESSVLELGAGCGAITRYLGETFGSVHAIEPSPVRAEIARERCRDLDNVSISCTDARNERFPSGYDLVAIIGVLEYAPVFIYPGDAPRDACLRFLNLARSALNDRGNLVLAIENRIGLDFWAGAPENHTGKPYDGVHDYPNAESPVTFTRTELKKLLADAGFPHTAFYYCFPDYHYARTILSSTGEESGFFLHNWVDFPIDSPRKSRKSTFNKPLAAKALSESGMLREFAISFLVVAGSQDVTDVDWVAKRFDMRRRKPFRIVTTLHVNPEPFVRKMPLHSTPENASDSSNNEVSLQVGDAPWQPGSLLMLEIERAALGRGFHGYLEGLISRYRNELVSQFGTGEQDSEGYPLLTPGSLDANFGNIIEDDAGEWHFIDEEWQVNYMIPIDFVIYRAMRYCLSRHGVREGHWRKMLLSLYPPYNRNRHRKNRQLADTYQREIYLNLVDPRLFRKGILGRIVRNDIVRPRLEKIWRRIPARIRTMIRSRL